MIMRNNPIGIFDSGVGGLTVAKEIMNLLPNEKIIYLGDTARAPYGTEEKTTITQFALEQANFLLKNNVKLLVVACNTITSTCFNEIQKSSLVPVLGVITQTARKAANQSKTKKVAVIGTNATIKSNMYPKVLKDIDPQIKVFCQACPLFVPLVENNFVSHPATLSLAKEYLGKFSKSKVDTIILGCTHYPFLSTSIQKVVGDEVVLIDCAPPTALEVKKILEENNLLSPTYSLGSDPKYQFYFTGSLSKVRSIASRIIDEDLLKNSKKVRL